MTVYGSLATYYDPTFIGRDFRGKYAWAAETVNVTVRIGGPPSQPVPTATTQCSAGSPQVFLTWNTTEDTDTYSILRDASTLATGLETTSYWDNAVQESTSYTYQITAVGAYGNTQSNLVTVTTGQCGTSITAAACTIQTIGHKNVANVTSRVKIKDRTPRITGTSNIADGVVTISITGQSTITAATYSNTNGYWSWTPNRSLSYGNHTVWVTITDPGHTSNIASDQAYFKIEEDEDDDSDDDQDDDDNQDSTPSTPSTPSATSSAPPASTAPTPGNQSSTTSPTTPSTEETRPVSPLSLTAWVTNPGKEVTAGENLTADVTIRKHQTDYQNIPVRYSITDGNDTEIDAFTQAEPLTGDVTVIPKNIPTSGLLIPGKYRFTASVAIPNFEISAEDFFTVKAKPAAGLAGGLSISLAFWLSRLSWLIIFLLIAIICFLALLGLEHRASTRALLHVTENILRDKGFISQRKEVRR